MKTTKVTISGDMCACVAYRRNTCSKMTLHLPVFCAWRNNRECWRNVKVTSIFSYKVVDTHTQICRPLLRRPQFCPRKMRMNFVKDIVAQGSVFCKYFGFLLSAFFH